MRSNNSLVNNDDEEEEEEDAAWLECPVDDDVEDVGLERFDVDAEADEACEEMVARRL